MKAKQKKLKPKRRTKMNMNVETITVNGKTYYSQVPTQTEFKGDLKIVVLQRGWVLIGKLERKGDQCFLHNASVIRSWGTKKGLGELAKDGPQSGTILDKCNGLVEFEALTKVLDLSVDENKWQNKL
jgi:hypothetical protein